MVHSPSAGAWFCVQARGEAHGPLGRRGQPALQLVLLSSVCGAGRQRADQGVGGEWHELGDTDRVPSHPPMPRGRLEGAGGCARADGSGPHCRSQIGEHSVWGRCLLGSYRGGLSSPCFPCARCRATGGTGDRPEGVGHGSGCKQSARFPGRTRLEWSECANGGAGRAYPLFSTKIRRSSTARRPSGERAYSSPSRTSWRHMFSSTPRERHAAGRREERRVTRRR